MRSLKVATLAADLEFAGFARFAVSQWLELSTFGLYWVEVGQMSKAARTLVSPE